MKIYNTHIFGAAGFNSAPSTNSANTTGRDLPENVFMNALNDMLQGDQNATTDGDNDNDLDENNNGNSDDNDDNNLSNNLDAATTLPSARSSTSCIDSPTIESTLISALERAIPTPILPSAPSDIIQQSEPAILSQSEHEPAHNRGRGGRKGGTSGKGKGRGRGRGTTASIIEGGGTTVPAIRRNTRSGGG